LASPSAVAPAVGCTLPSSPCNSSQLGANSYGFYPETSIKEGVKGTIEWFILNKKIVDKKINNLKK
jgi:dTDP-D-glucose 4,6-dehydratase